MKWKETEQFRATLQCIKELIGLYRSTIGDFGISENEFWIWYKIRLIACQSTRKVVEYG